MPGTTYIKRTGNLNLSPIADIISLLKDQSFWSSPFTKERERARDAKQCCGADEDVLQRLMDSPW